MLPPIFYKFHTFIIHGNRSASPWSSKFQKNWRWNPCSPLPTPRSPLPAHVLAFPVISHTPRRWPHALTLSFLTAQQVARAHLANSLRSPCRLAPHSLPLTSPAILHLKSLAHLNPRWSWLHLCAPALVGLESAAQLAPALPIQLAPTHLWGPSQLAPTELTGSRTSTSSRDTSTLTTAPPRRSSPLPESPLAGPRAGQTHRSHPAAFHWPPFHDLAVRPDGSSLSSYLMDCGKGCTIHYSILPQTFFLCSTNLNPLLQEISAEGGDCIPTSVEGADCAIHKVSELYSWWIKSCRIKKMRIRVSTCEWLGRSREFISHRSAYCLSLNSPCDIP
jgi:hypothetical protein